MKLISTASPHWQADCYNAAEIGEAFYVPNLNPDSLDFLCALALRFPRHRVWGENTFYFNPPLGVALESQQIPQREASAPRESA